MKFRIMTGLVGLALLAASNGWATLDDEEKTKVDALAQTLSLSTEQKAKLEVERESSKLELLRLEKTWQSLHDQLRQEIRRPQPDPSRIETLSAELGKIRGQIIALRSTSLIFLKSILNPKQMEILEPGQPGSQK